MREEAAENKLLKLLRQRDGLDYERAEKTKKPKTKKKKTRAKAIRPSPVQEQIKLLGKIFHTAEPSSKYTKVQNTFYDDLAKNLSLAEQSIYNYLYRLSLGHHRRICIVGYNALGKATGIKSRETIRTAVSGLTQKEYISVIGDVGPKGSIYFVYLPQEIQQDISRENILKTSVNGATVSNNSILKNGILNISVLNSNTLNVLNNSILKNGTVDENSTKKEENTTVLNNSILKNGTHIKKELNNKEKLSQRKTRESLVNKFYKKLNSRASQEKKSKGYEEAEKLLNNYTPEEIEYTIEWAIKNVSDIHSFALISHVIDQALRNKNKQEEEKKVKKLILKRTKQQQEREKREKELQEKISKIKSSLSEEELAKIRQEAEKAANTQGDRKKFGQNVLVRVKENEIIKNLYLNKG